MTLTEFLLARIAEDEATSLSGRHGKPDRIARECEAKRRIVEKHEIGIDPCDAHDGYTMRSIPCDTVLDLAAIYADHPDYRDEWRP